MTSNPFSLDERVAIVTGARSGIGQALAVALADAGAAAVVGVGRRPSLETATEVRARGAQFLDLSVDLTTIDADGAADLVAEVVSALGRVDVLVNNAGMIHRSPAIAVREPDWQAVIHLNLTAPFLLSQAVGRHVVQAGEAGQRRTDVGRTKIINIASLLSFQGGINTSSYTASKSGLVGLTHLLCNEWAAQGINVNAIAPGYIATDATAALRDDTTRSSEIEARIPTGRWGRPGDVGGAAVFLASAASDYVNGIVLPVDGGWLAR